MTRSTIALLGLILLTACIGQSRRNAPESAPTRGETIDALSAAVRARDFGAFFDLHAEEAFADERAQWEKGREGWRRDPEQARAAADRLGVRPEELDRITFRDGFVAMMRHQLEARPHWVTHLRKLKVLDERVDGDTAVVRVRYGEPKADEEHDLTLVIKEGRWLVRNWD